MFNKNYGSRADGLIPVFTCTSSPSPQKVYCKGQFITDVTHLQGGTVGSLAKVCAKQALANNKINICDLPNILG